MPLSRPFPALEHAIDVEGVRDVVVLGHSHCAAVTRLVDPERQRSPSAMDAFLRHSEGVCRALSERRRHLQPGMLVDIAAQENVLLQLEHLRGHPSVVLHRFSDPVRLYAWFFHVNSGRVLAYNELQRRFQPLDQNYEREIARSISSK
jgi:carbonic anhydrase